jgi:Holliday junction resolvase RusA-like endonuclease
MLEGEVKVDLTFVLPSRRSDGHNRIKVLLDVLQGIAYKNDRQVQGGSWRCEYDAANPRVVVVIEGQT